MSSKRKLDAEEEPAVLSEYEQQRAALIERNRARLAALGLPDLVASIDKDLKPKAKKPKKTSKAAEAPSRHSRRLHDEEPEVDGEADEHVQFAMFIIDGECPKCGKVVTKGHRNHWQGCSGTGEQRQQARDDATEDDQEPSISQPDRRAKSGRSLQERLSELEMGGLVELTDEHAKFVVLGSTGRHYTVTLSTGKGSCQCVDFRIRKHACKHQRLIYDQLGEPPGSNNWHQAVEAQMQTMAVKQTKQTAADDGSTLQSTEAPQMDPIAAKFL
ncbi:hypothetical protein WJX74_003212 [Apatococcus lobatus]|uniref:SWIM-type domain-containing protein n=1 Tax=Apatococcus lobatus TaxID=904363 RepID=A0AAW1RK96_9CHLO